MWNIWKIALERSLVTTCGVTVNGSMNFKSSLETIYWGEWVEVLESKGLRSLRVMGHIAFLVFLQQLRIYWLCLALFLFESVVSVVSG